MHKASELPDLKLHERRYVCYGQGEFTSAVSDIKLEAGELCFNEGSVRNCIDLTTVDEIVSFSKEVQFITIGLVPEPICGPKE